MGSPEREKLYRRVAKHGASGLLVPTDVTLLPTTIEWPVPEKYNEWITSLGDHGFQHFGQFTSPETKSCLDFWINQENDLRGVIISVPTKGMWLSVSTLYEDDSSFSAANKDSTGLDQNPNRKIRYLGPEATADAVIDCAVHNRPDGHRRPPSAELLLEDYKRRWRTGVEWRRARGTTAEEVKRVDERRGKAKAAGESTS